MEYFTRFQKIDRNFAASHFVESRSHETSLAAAAAVVAAAAAVVVAAVLAAAAAATTSDFIFEIMIPGEGSGRKKVREMGKRETEKGEKRELQRDKEEMKT